MSDNTIRWFVLNDSELRTSDRGEALSASDVARILNEQSAKIEALEAELIDERIEKHAAREQWDYFEKENKRLLALIDEAYKALPPKGYPSFNAARDILAKARDE